MNTKEQQEAEQAVRDLLDGIIRDDHGHDGEATDWELQVASNGNPNRAPNACHPNQTVLRDRAGAFYLVTVTMLRPPREKRGGK